MRIFTLLFFIALCFPALSQNDARLAKGLSPLEQIDMATMPILSNKALLQEELNRRGPGIAPKFAKPIEVDYTPDNKGTWEIASNGNAVWRLLIRSEGAESLNLGFGKFYMPEGGTLVLYSPDYSRIIGPFSKADNETHEQLWTPILEGDMMVVEVQLPVEEKSNLALRLDYINHDFLGFMQIASGSCNLDVICGAADGYAIVDHYRDIIRSAATVSSVGSNFCSGFLVNNVRQDCTPYYMTAEHCGISATAAATVVVYWNFENSTCREPGSAASGGNGDGVFGAFNSGAIRRAGYGPTDFTLLELDDEIPVEGTPYMAGWNAEPNLPPADTIIGIHHPSGDEKRISFEFGQTYLGNWGQGDAADPNGNHVIIPDWDIGTTEGGSSGSPIYNSAKQVIGQLHGGGAACGNDLYDSYGWISSSWEGGGTPATRLKDWLDPDNTGMLSIGGKDCSFNVSTDITFIESCVESGTDAVFTLTASDNFIGDVTLTASGLPMGATGDFSVNPLMPNDQSVFTVSGLTNAASGLYTISVDASDGVNESTTILTLSLFNGAPETTTLTSPGNMEGGQSTAPSFNWAAQAPGTFYEIQVASDSMFTDIFAMASGLENTSYNTGGLEILSNYFWRVRATNLCGDSDWSDIFSFRTAEIMCGPSTSDNVPVDITAIGTPTITSTLEVMTDGLISDVNVTNLFIDHTYVGDLFVTLTSPDGITVTILDRPGEPASGFGCSGDNIEVSFDDQAMDAYDLFENACGDLPAIAGTFQPFESMSAFNGGSAAGTWTLTVTDNANADGGVLTGWGLDLCSTVPLDYSLRVENNPIEICDTENVSFEMVLGLDFESSIALNAINVPAGSDLQFSANPVEPGDTVTVNITGGAVPADYVISVEANDGMNANVLPLGYNVSTMPSSFSLMNPVDAAVDVAQLAELNWMPSDFADGYTLQLFSDPTLMDNIFTTTLETNSFTTQALPLGETYYWTVQAANNCGAIDASEVFSFTIIGDLSFMSSALEATVCTGDGADFDLTIGEGYLNPVQVTYTINPMPGVGVVAFSVDPSAVVPGSTITASVFEATPVTPGSYTVTFTIDDGVHVGNQQVTVNVDGSPNVSSLIQPSDTETGVLTSPSFSWSNVPEADNYLIEIATDVGFTDVVLSETVSGTGFNFSGDLDFNTQYFWTISAENECGASLSQTFTFVTEFEVGIEELMDKEISIQPNPTKGEVLINLGEYEGSNLQLDLYSIDGKLMQQFSNINSANLNVQLNSFADGVYLFRFTNEEGTLTKRVVLQK